MNRQQLEKRVVIIAEKTLKLQNYVSFIDILLGIGWLQPIHLQSWRKGQIPSLETSLQANLSKISYAMHCFRHWGTRKGLKPSESSYIRKARNKKIELQFSKSGKAAIEKSYRTHYISPLLSEKKQQTLKDKLQKSPVIVIYSIINNASCENCQKELLKGSFIFKENNKTLCMNCSGFDKMEYLPAGNATLTRRAKKYSKEVAIVVRFSKARKRYERQGLLVETPALRKAEQEIDNS